MSKPNLYALPVDGAKPESYCGGNLTGDNESCLAVAEIPGAQGAFVLTDTKPEGAGYELRATAEELDNFAIGWVAKRRLSV
jgi:hypothetical protein